MVVAIILIIYLMGSSFLAGRIWYEMYDAGMEQKVMYTIALLPFGLLIWAYLGVLTYIERRKEKKRGK